MMTSVRVLRQQVSGQAHPGRLQAMQHLRGDAQDI